MRLLWMAAGVVVVDQATKLVVHQTMSMPPYRSIDLIGDWLKFTFTENPGMAFGISFGPAGMVTAFSILATLLIIVYLYRVRKGYALYRASLALILGGAIGNIIDRMFYGMLFGYGNFFQGRVVDFIHVNLWSGYVPDAVPLVGGSYMALFPIWNVADMAIVVGVVGILVFQKKFHKILTEAEETKAAEAKAAEAEGAAATPESEGVTATPDLSVNGVAPPGTAEAPPVWTPPAIGEDKPPE
ncbi:MAG: signal peptidase II [Bacteroidetes bacterium]|nr:signal peptidase II [Bacteroidota bacterium]